MNTGPRTPQQSVIDSFLSVAPTSILPTSVPSSSWNQPSRIRRPVSSAGGLFSSPQQRITLSFKDDDDDEIVAPTKKPVILTIESSSSSESDESDESDDDDEKVVESPAPSSSSSESSPERPLPLPVKKVSVPRKSSSSPSSLVRPPCSPPPPPVVKLPKKPWTLDELLACIPELVLSEFQRGIVNEALSMISPPHNLPGVILSLPMSTGKTVLSLLLALYRLGQAPPSFGRADIFGRVNTFQEHVGWDASALLRQHKADDESWFEPYEWAPMPKILVVAKLTIVTVWKEEWKKFYDRLPYRLQILDLQSLQGKTFHHGWTPSADVVVITPEFLARAWTKKFPELHRRFVRRDPMSGTNIYQPVDQPFLGPVGEHPEFRFLYALRWSTVILDEAHQIGNPDSVRCLAAAALCADKTWLLSGTALAEPRVPKLFGLHLLLKHPDAPRTLPEFRQYVTNPAYLGMERTCMVTRPENLDCRTSIIDIDLDGNPIPLPPGAPQPVPTKEDTNEAGQRIALHRQIISHDLSDVEKKVYENVRKMLENLRQKLERYRRHRELYGGQIQVFSHYVITMISHMRQCLVCPLIPITAAALDVAIGLQDEERKDMANHFMDHLRSLELEDWLNDENSLRSTRIGEALAAIKRHPGQRIVIFSCFRTVLNVLQYFVRKEQPERQCYTIEGRSNVKRRMEIVEAFRQSDGGLFFLTYELCEGLNLQCASVVMIMDFFWNSARTDQAVYRLLRRGQLAAVVRMIMFVSNTGIERALLAIQVSKRIRDHEVRHGALKTGIKTANIDQVLALIDKSENMERLRQLQQRPEDIKEIPIEPVARDKGGGGDPSASDHESGTDYDSSESERRRNAGTDLDPSGNHWSRMREQGWQPRRQPRPQQERVFGYNRQPPPRPPRPPPSTSRAVEILWSDTENDGDDDSDE